MTSTEIGRYRVENELDRGGMATVYRAYDPLFKREVAIKVLPRAFQHDETFRIRFEREAQTIAGLEHPAIVPVHDFGEQGEQPYLVMRLMTGGSLADRLGQGALSLPEAARLFRRLAAGLDAAHASGIVHRDLKPANILFDQYDQPYLTDFGIAKLVESSTVALTAAGGLVGTPAYMSPEQARGGGDVDHRSDIYSMGIILYQVLSGVLPYQADTAVAWALMHINEPVPHIREVRPDLPEGCDQIISIAMAKDPQKRFQSASALSAALRAVADGREPALAMSPYPGAPYGEETVVESESAPSTAALGATVLEGGAEVAAASGGMLGSEVVGPPEARTRPWPKIAILVFGVGAVSFLCIALILFALFSANGPGPVNDVLGLVFGNGGTATPTLSTATRPGIATETATVVVVDEPDTATPTNTSMPTASTAPTATATETAAPTPTIPTVPTAPIVFDSTRDGIGGEIYIMDTDGSNQVRLTDNRVHDDEPDQSPDGEWIAYESRDSDNRWVIIVMRSDGTESRPLSEGRQPAWSPDGRFIAYETTGDRQIWIIDVERGIRRQLTHDNRANRSPSWSPDGDQLVVMAEIDNTWQLVVINVDSGAQRVITSGSEDRRFPVWSPAGDVIAYNTVDNGNPGHIWVIDTSGRNERQVTSVGQNGRPAWSPDGRYLLFNSDRDGDWNIYRINLDGSDPEPLTSTGEDQRPDWGS